MATAQMDSLTEIALSKIDLMDLSQIARMIAKDWTSKGKGVYFGAKPYLEAMFSLHSIDDDYMMDSGQSVVLYFLANAATWRGPVAKAVKTELKRRAGCK